MHIKVQYWEKGEKLNISKIRFVIEDLSWAQLIDICTYIDYTRKMNPEGLYKDTFKKNK